MSGRSAYTPEQWRIVGGLPYYAAAFVVAAGPHHSTNTIRSMLTGANAFAKGPASDNPLIMAARADSAGPNGDPGSTKHAPDNIQRLRDLVQQANQFIDDASGADGTEYKTEVLRVATGCSRRLEGRGPRNVR